MNIAITTAYFELGFWGLGCPQRVLRIGKYEPLGEYITVLENALLVRGTQPSHVEKIFCWDYSWLTGRHYLTPIFPA